MTRAGRSRRASCVAARPAAPQNAGSSHSRRSGAGILAGTASTLRIVCTVKLGSACIGSCDRGTSMWMS